MNQYNKTESKKQNKPKSNKPGKKLFLGFSAYMRASKAWPWIFSSSCFIGSGRPSTQFRKNERRTHIKEGHTLKKDTH
jgi:hypothetical protein